MDVESNVLSNSKRSETCRQKAQIQNICSDVSKFPRVNPQAYVHVARALLLFWHANKHPGSSSSAIPHWTVALQQHGALRWVGITSGPAAGSLGVPCPRWTSPRDPRNTDSWRPFPQTSNWHGGLGQLRPRPGAGHLAGKVKGVPCTPQTGFGDGSRGQAQGAFHATWIRLAEPSLREPSAICFWQAGHPSACISIPVSRLNDLTLMSPSFPEGCGALAKQLVDGDSRR